MICAHEGCGQPTAYRPVLLLRVHLGHPPAKGELDLMVCAAHAREMKLAEVLSDDGWVHLVGLMRAAGKAAPTRSLTTLEWLPVRPEGRA